MNFKSKISFILIGIFVIGLFVFNFKNSKKQTTGVECYFNGNTFISLSKNGNQVSGVFNKDGYLQNYTGTLEENVDTLYPQKIKAIIKQPGDDAPFHFYEEFFLIDKASIKSTFGHDGYNLYTEKYLDQNNVWIYKNENMLIYGDWVARVDCADVPNEANTR